MGRLNKKLMLKSKNAEKVAKVKAKIESEAKAMDCSDQALLLSKPPKISKLSQSSLLAVPKKLAKITKKEKMKVKSAVLRKKLQLMAEEKTKGKPFLRLSIFQLDKINFAQK
jgi:hypothetical protein